VSHGSEYVDPHPHPQRPVTRTRTGYITRAQLYSGQLGSSLASPYLSLLACSFRVLLYFRAISIIHTGPHMQWPKRQVQCISKLALPTFPTLQFSPISWRRTTRSPSVLAQASGPLQPLRVTDQWCGSVAIGNSAALDVLAT